VLYDNGWIALGTALVNSTESANHYRAYTDSLAYLAITGESAGDAQAEPASEQTAEPIAGDNETQAPEDTSDETGIMPAAKENIWTRYSPLYAAPIMILAIAAYALRAKKKSGGAYQAPRPAETIKPEAPMAEPEGIPQKAITEEEKLDDIEKRIEALKRRLDER